MIASAVLVPVLIVVGLFLYQFVYVGAPLWDEWHCSKGEAPVESDDGGSICAPRGSDLSAGGGGTRSATVPSLAKVDVAGP